MNRRELLMAAAGLPLLSAMDLAASDLRLGRIGNAQVGGRALAYDEAAKLQLAPYYLHPGDVREYTFEKAQLHLDLDWHTQDLTFDGDVQPDHVRAILGHGSLTIQPDGSGRLDYANLWGPKHGLEEMEQRANLPGEESWDGDFRKVCCTGVLILEERIDPQVIGSEHRQRRDVNEFELRGLFLVSPLNGRMPFCPDDTKDLEWARVRKTRLTCPAGFMAFKSHLEHEPDSDYDFGEDEPE